MNNKLSVNQCLGTFMTKEKIKALQTFRERLRSKKELIAECEIEEFMAAGFTQESVSKIALDGIAYCISRSRDTAKSPNA